MEFAKFEFLIPEVKKVKFGSAENIGCGCRNVSISQKVQIYVW